MISKQHWLLEEVHVGCKVECQVLLSLVSLHFSRFRRQHPLSLGLGVCSAEHLTSPYDTCKVQAGRGVTLFFNRAQARARQLGKWTPDEAVMENSRHVEQTKPAPAPDPTHTSQ